MNSSISTISNKKEALTSSRKRREASLADIKTRSSQWEEQKKWKRRINLSWRQSKQICLYPPIWARVSCYVSSQSRSICPSTPSHSMSAPPPHRQKAPISTAPDSSLVCSQLPCWLHRPVPMPTYPRARFQTALTLAYKSPSNTASVKSRDPHLVHLQLKHYSSFSQHRNIWWWNPTVGLGGLQFL